MRALRWLRAWTCYQIVIWWPRGVWLNPLCRETWLQRASWWLHQRMLPHAGTWAYQDEVRRDLGRDPWEPQR